jgi:hypothetical protein
MMRGVLSTAILLVYLAGCASGRRLDLAEGALAGYQQLHHEACLDDPALLPAYICDPHLLRLRALELGMERETTERLLWAADAWRVARPHIERLAGQAIGIVLGWLAGALSQGGEQV